MTGAVISVMHLTLSKVEISDSAILIQWTNGFRSFGRVSVNTGWYLFKRFNFNYMKFRSATAIYGRSMRKCAEIYASKL